MKAFGYRRGPVWRRAVTAVTLVLLAGFVEPLAAQTEPDEQEFLAVKPALQQQMRHPRAETRLAALRKLEAYPTVGAAKLLVAQGLTNPSPDFRRASYSTLLKFRNVGSICDYLREAVAKELSRTEANPKSCGMLAILLASDLPESQVAAAELLDQAAASPAHHGALLCALADVLGNQGDETSLSSLITITKLPVFERDFGFRRATVQAIIRIRRPEAVDALIALLGTAKGEVRADILRHLAAISGQQPGDPSHWDEWWRANRATFAFPSALDLPGFARDTDLFQGLPSYYEIPLCAQKIVFVLDTSTSMSGPRILRAKQELIRAVNDLPSDVEFNIVAFNQLVYEWQRKLVEASPKQKKAAILFVNRQGLGGHTASYDALKAAFKFDTEAIYFLTDGAPTAGKIRAPADIVTALTTENERRRITINSIGVGVGPPGNAFDTFLRALSSRNFGDYRRVDQ